VWTTAIVASPGGVHVERSPRRREALGHHRDVHAGARTDFVCNRSSIRRSHDHGGFDAADAGNEFGHSEAWAQRRQGTRGRGAREQERERRRRRRHERRYRTVWLRADRVEPAGRASALGKQLFERPRGSVLVDDRRRRAADV
jgi:hypothetical protein